MTTHRIVVVVRSFPILFLSCISLLLQLKVGTAEVDIMSFVSDGSINRDDCTENNAETVVSDAFEDCIYSATKGEYSGIKLEHITPTSLNVANRNLSPELTVRNDHEGQEQQQQDRQLQHSCDECGPFDYCDPPSRCELCWLQGCLDWYGNKKNWPDGTTPCTVCTNRRRLEETTSHNEDHDAMRGSETRRLTTLSLSSSTSLTKITTTEDSVKLECTEKIIDVVGDLNRKGNYCHGNAKKLDLSVTIS